MTILLSTIGLTFITNIFPDYVSLLETRIVLTVMRRSTLPKLIWLIIDGLFTGGTAVAWNALVLFVVSPTAYDRQGVLDEVLSIYVAWLVFPAFFTSIWLWLYAGSGFLLKAARRFDIGFDWFNRHFEIEKKPLQSIGLVAGVLGALVYWAAVILSWIV